MKLRALVLAGGFLVAAAVPAGALAQVADPAGGGAEAARGPTPPPVFEPDPPKPVKIKLQVRGLDGGRATVGERVSVIGTVRPFVGGQRVEVRLGNRGDVVKRKTPLIRQLKGKNAGRFKLRSKPLLKPGKYRARAHKRATAAQEGGFAKSREFKLRYPDIDPGNRGPEVELFNDLLGRQGYYAPNGSKYSAGTERAVMAFRKVNGMARNFQATPQIFAKLAAGKGGFKIRYPGAGKHAEVSIAKQVMALAKDGKALHVFHVSTGAPATPSDRGHFRFYRKDPGFNSIGMYYSVYYNRGEATHGYHSVPPYPASHGCIRNPIPDSRFIYNWIDLGDSMYVY